VTPRRSLRFTIVLAAHLLASSVAAAGGLLLPVHSVRTLARGGAFVAGADDPEALWLDPAGLAHLAGDGNRALLFDAAFVYQTVSYAQRDAAGDLAAPVENQQPGQLVPTIAGALAIGDRLVIAGGLASPYAGVHRYAPDGAQRFASIDNAGSRFAVVTAGLAYRVSSRLRVGATLQNVVSQLATRVAVSGCPGTMTCAPEDRSFDAVLAIEQDDFVSPTGSVGVQYDALETLTLGLALQGPARVEATGRLAVELPSSPAFDQASVRGDRARLAFTLPAVVRAGVEWRPGRWRIEAALTTELWSMHDEVVLEPIDVVVDDAPGGPYALAAMTIPRAYRTSLAPAFAIEWHGPGVLLGAGYAYETAAAPASHVSVLAIDAGKHVIGLGGGYDADGWQIGVALGIAILERVDVGVDVARVPQLAPLAEGASERAVNAGRYDSRFLLAGLRFARRW
jgi:long-chain fatty acid transport protein